MLLRSLLKSAHQLVFLLVLFLSGPVYADIPCDPVISYQSITGEYTDVLGKADEELKRIAQSIADQNPAYCNMDIQIYFDTPLSSRQLVYKNPASDQHYFKVVYRAPTYRLAIRDAGGQLLEEEIFANDWVTTQYPTGTPFSSKEALYQSWNDQRVNIYTQLEEGYNNYNDLKNFLYSLMPAEPAVATTDPTSTPDVLPSAPRYDAPSNPVENTTSDPIENKGNTSSSKVEKTEISTPRKGVAQQQQKENNGDKKVKPSKQKNTRQASRRSTKASRKEATNAKEIPALNTLVSFEFCSPDNIAIINNTDFSIQVMMPHPTESYHSAYQFSNGLNQQYISYPYNDQTWYSVQYDERQFDKDLVRFTKAIKSVYADLQLAEVGAGLTKTMLEIMPISPRLKYNPRTDEVENDYVTAVLEREMYKLGTDIFVQFQQAEAIRQLEYFYSLMFEAFYLQEYYRQQNEKGLERTLLSTLPAYKTKFPKRGTPTFILKGSAFFPVVEPGTYSEFWDTRTPNWNVQLEVGLPFEKKYGYASNSEYHRPYLELGYQQLVLQLNQPAFLDNSFVSGASPEQRTQLQTSEGVRLRTYTFNAGLMYKIVMKKHNYVDLGVGAQKIWRSAIDFSSSENYFAQSGLELSEDRSEAVLDDSAIIPYARLTIGAFMSAQDRKKQVCQPRIGGLDVFFRGSVRYWNPKATAEYPLYQATTGDAIIDPGGGKKIYFYIGMGVGIGFL